MIGLLKKDDIALRKRVTIIVIAPLLSLVGVKFQSQITIGEQVSYIVLLSTAWFKVWKYYSESKKVRT
jgi:hypothetical protein